MTDRELLELAAKAAGIEVRFIETLWEGRSSMGELPYLRTPHHIGDLGRRGDDWKKLWNPLTDDGDALRLAVKLQLLINISSAHTEINWFDKDRSETFEVEQWDNGMTPEQWTRRAIVRAAAAIGAQPSQGVSKP